VTTLVSTGENDEPLEEPAADVAASDDGRVIAFVTAGEAFGVDTGGDAANVFVVDERTGEGRLVFEGRDGAAADGPSRPGGLPGRRGRRVRLRGLQPRPR
jgi:hypothetical protein